MASDDWYTTAVCAARVGVTRQTIDRWIREQKLPARRIAVGGRAIYRIRPVDLAAFIRRYVRDDWS